MNMFLFMYFFVFRTNINNIFEHYNSHLYDNSNNDAALIPLKHLYPNIYKLKYYDAQMVSINTY